MCLIVKSVSVICPLPPQVQELMEMTCRTEEEVCSALHDADNDMQAACNLLLEETQPIQVRDRVEFRVATAGVIEDSCGVSSYTYYEE